ncbi:hypothetical protein Cgig2_014323 [Carnegiea gigantea]|uniref:Uncharacterized protein n=1 Tax=Carnegiea gigantea TaxID=171969 RepID=A0A9Q1GPH7_9CARY|nr:hypothetical protein Cgig2_014323 [Carnegiea gigantea]
MADLNVTAEGELAAFLSFWLSRFVLLHGEAASDPDHPGKANAIFRCHCVIGAVEISGVTGNSCTKEKPSISSSEKGKSKVSGEICWLSSNIEEIFGVVEATVKIEELVDVDRVKALFDHDLTCSSEIADIEDQLNNLFSKATKLKVKEQEVLKKEERIRKMREDLTIQQ